MTQGPVFIVGAPRSGSSILYRTLLKHPSFAVRGPEELALAESSVVNHLDSAPRWKPPRPRSLWLYFLGDEAAYSTFCDEVRKLTGGVGVPDDGSAPAWATPVLEAFVRHAVAVRGCRRMLEKTPTHIERADWLLAALPTAKLLFIHRHPVDTYTSYLRRAAVDPQATWADLSVEEFAEIYRRQGRIAQRLVAEVPERFRAVSYERFTSDPAAVVAEVCEFLGEDFVPEIVDEPNPDLSRARFDPHLYGKITTRTKDNSDYVDEATARKVMELAADVAAGWGYTG